MFLSSVARSLNFAVWIWSVFVVTIQLLIYSRAFRRLLLSLTASTALAYTLGTKHTYTHTMFSRWRVYYFVCRVNLCCIRVFFYRK